MPRMSLIQHVHVHVLDEEMRLYQVCVGDQASRPS